MIFKATLVGLLAAGSAAAKCAARSAVTDSAVGTVAAMAVAASASSTADTLTLSSTQKRAGHSRFQTRTKASATAVTAPTSTAPAQATTDQAAEPTTTETPKQATTEDEQPTEDPTTAAAATSSAASSGGAIADSAAISAANANALLTAHNDFRAKYGANPVSWSAEVANYAYTMNAEKCVFAHTDNNIYGENIAAGSAWDPTGAASLFTGWTDEASTQGGHFTAVVWRHTTEIGCSYVDCTGKGDWASYLVCDYNPPGNVAGFYTQNVGTLGSAVSAGV